MGRGRILTGGLALVAVVLVGQQFVLPPVLENAVDDRLTARGGAAEVQMSAFPAFQLLFGGGKSLAIDASDVEVDIEADNDVFERLDGFGEVDVNLTNVVSGPFHTERFALSRAEGEDDYSLVLRSSITGRDLSEFAAEQLGGALGNVAELLTGIAPGISDVPLPIALDATVMVDDDGRVEITEGDGTVAGIPAGPIVEAIGGAILSQL